MRSSREGKATVHRRLHRLPPPDSPKRCRFLIVKEIRPDAGSQQHLQPHGAVATNTRESSADLVASERLSSMTLTLRTCLSGLRQVDTGRGTKIQSKRAETASAYLNEKGDQRSSPLSTRSRAADHAAGAILIALAGLRPRPHCGRPDCQQRAPPDQLPGSFASFGGAADPMPNYASMNEASASPGKHNGSSS